MSRHTGPPKRSPHHDVPRTEKRAGRGSHQQVMSNADVGHFDELRRSIEQAKKRTDA